MEKQRAVFYAWPVVNGESPAVEGWADYARDCHLALGDMLDAIEAKDAEIAQLRAAIQKIFGALESGR